MYKAITWTKISQQGLNYLKQVYNHFSVPNFCVLQPVQTLFSYIIQSFCILLSNKQAANYIHFSMSSISDEIRAGKLSENYWYLVQVLVHTMHDFFFCQFNDIKVIFGTSQISTYALLGSTFYGVIKQYILKFIIGTPQFNKIKELY